MGRRVGGRVVGNWIPTHQTGVWQWGGDRACYRPSADCSYPLWAGTPPAVGHAGDQWDSFSLFRLLYLLLGLGDAVLKDPPTHPQNLTASPL